MTLLMLTWASGLTRDETKDTGIGELVVEEKACKEDEAKGSDKEFVELPTQSGDLRVVNSFKNLQHVKLDLFFLLHIFHKSH